MNCMVNIVSQEMDCDAEVSVEFQSESKLSNSLESGVTVECSRDDKDSKLDVSAGWTNEKHNSYLDYLENSFVNQLYSLLGGESQRLSRTPDVQANSLKSTDQFSVLQNGSWQKVNFGKKRAHLETSSEFHCQKKSSRRTENHIGNYTMGTSVQGNISCNEETKKSSDKATTRTSMRNSLGHEYPAQSSAEASGQNFREEEKKGSSNSEVSRKRKRDSNEDDSSLNDQVVP